MRNNKPRRNMRLITAESAITAALLSMPIMAPFYLELGLNQEQIALSQMAFTVVVMVLNLPLGWVADRFSRKWANAIGDLTVALAFLLYSTVQNFWQIVFCETLCGIGLALSQGVDSTLLKHFAAKIDSSDNFYQAEYAKMASWRQATTLIILLMGGPIGAISFRLAIAASAIPMIIGAAFAVMIDDDSEKLKATSKNPFKDMALLVSRYIRNEKFRISVAAFAVAREVTHGIIWCFTPLMLSVGIPLTIVSMG